MNVLFAASEAVPFVKTGGLADVVGSLPQALNAAGADVRVILPKHEQIPDALQRLMKHRGYVYVPLGWRNQYCGVAELKHDGVTYYFIDNEWYFKRRGLYGYGDDAERYAFFSRAVVAALPLLGWTPDIVHAHDWQTALIPLFRKAFYANDPAFPEFRSVFTIHNLMYQGRFSRHVLEDLLGVDFGCYLEGLEYYGDVNFMKAGLRYADRITTVSPTYAREIMEPYYGEGLHGLLQERSEELAGILNGVDVRTYDPMVDPHIESHYRSSYAKKQKNKAALQEQLGLPVAPDKPLIAIVSRLVPQKGLNLVACILDELLAYEDFQLVVLGTGEARYEDMFRHAAWQYPDKVSAHITFDVPLSHRIYAASDIFLMPSKFEPCGISQLIALRYGSVPIVRETGGLTDTVQPYNEFTGAGCGFTFANYNAHDMLFTIRRALGFYRDREAWTRIIQNGVRQDYSWDASAKRYLELYRELLQVRSTLTAFDLAQAEPAVYYAGARGSFASRAHVPFRLTAAAFAAAHFYYRRLSSTHPNRRRKRARRKRPNEGRRHGRCRNRRL